MSVVVGYVATPEGEAALAVAQAEARRRGVGLVVVVSDRSSRLGIATAAQDDTLEGLRERLAAGDLNVEVLATTRGREVADDIVEAATEHGAQLIVIGLRRRSPMGKLLLGSNAQRILLDAPCPVLAVKAD